MPHESEFRSCRQLFVYGHYNVDAETLCHRIALSEGMEEVYLHGAQLSFGDFLNVMRSVHWVASFGDCFIDFDGESSLDNFSSSVQTLSLENVQFIDVRALNTVLPRCKSLAVLSLPRIRFGASLFQIVRDRQVELLDLTCRSLDEAVISRLGELSAEVLLSPFQGRQVDKARR